MKYFLLGVLIILLILSSSCISTKDVTHDSAYALGYKTGEQYVLKSKVFIVKVDRCEALRLPRFVGVDFNKYTRNKKDWPNIHGIVNAGTILKINKLTNERTFEDNYLWVYAEIINGEFAGREVLINFISIQSSIVPPLHELPLMDTYNPKYLEPVDPALLTK